MQNFSKTFSLTTTALLVAIGIVLGQLAIYIPLFGFPSLRLSLSLLPIIIVGSLFGPIFGATAGFLTDVLTYFLVPNGPYFPGFTLNAIIVGTLPGIYFYFLRKRGIKFSFYYFNMILSIIAAIFSVLYIAFIENIESKVGEISSFYKILMITIAIGITVVFNIAMYLIKKKYEFKHNIYSIDKLIFINIIIYIIVHLVLTPIWINQIYGLPIGISIIARVFKSLIYIPVQIFLQNFIIKIFLKQKIGVKA